MSEPTRREFVAGVGTLPLTTSTLTSSRSDVLTPLAAAYARSEGLIPRSFDVSVREYGGSPSWSVSVGEDDVDALRDWESESEDRVILRVNEEAGVATVAAPVSDISDSVIDSGLESSTYIEWIDLDVRATLVEPVSRVPTADDLDTDYSALESILVSDEPTPDGLAYEVEESTVGDARELVNDDTSEDGSGVTVAVIDTGVTNDLDVFGREIETDDGETTLETRILDASRNYVAAGDPTVGETDDVYTVEDGNGHGTWVASAIASATDDPTYRGVVPDADVLALRALDDDGRGSTADIAAALRYAADQGVESACMSLGSPTYSADLADAVEYAVESDVDVVAAAGNDRQASRYLNYPASHPETIAVGATGVDDSGSVRSASFSNVGPSPGTLDFSAGETADVEVDVAAPGMEIEADTGEGLRSLSGTSMAAPFVAATAALIDDEDVADRLASTASREEELSPSEAGGGLLDVSAALSHTESDSDLEEVMSDTAALRDTGYRSESAARGRFLWGL